MKIDWNTIGFTAADWAAALELLVHEALRVGAGDNARRDGLVDQLTEFIARSPAVAAELDGLAAKIIDDLLATEVSARLQRLAVRSSEMSKHVDYLRMATQGRARATTAPGATGAGAAEAVREQAHEAVAAVSKRLLPEVQSVLDRVRALRPKTGR